MTKFLGVNLEGVLCWLGDFVGRLIVPFVTVGATLTV